MTVRDDSTWARDTRDAGAGGPTSVLRRTSHIPCVVGLPVRPPRTWRLLLFAATTLFCVGGAPGEARAGSWAFSVAPGLSPLGIDLGLSELGTRIGPTFRFTQLYLNLDYARYGLRDKWVESFEGLEDTDTYEASAGLLTVGAGARAFLAERRAGAVVPYFAGGLFFLLPFVESDDTDTEPEGGNSFGGTAGLGAEYFLADAFSFGAEAGLAYSRLQARFDYSSYESQVSTGSHLQVYSALSVNFYFGGPAE